MSEFDIESFATSFGFTSFTTIKTETYTSLIQFYKLFGFSVLKTYTKDANTIGIDLNGISNDSRKECWIVSYPISRMNAFGEIIPFQETLEYNMPDLCSKLKDFNNCVILKLRLVSHDVHKNTELPGEVVFFSSNLKKIESIARINNIEIINADDSNQNVKFYLKDPAGNLIGFTNYPKGLNCDSINSPSEFFETDNIEPTNLLSDDLIENTNGGERKKRIAVMTSGGDSPGMCAAVRAVVRAGIYYGCEVYGCYEGYSGLVQGGELLKKMEWETVRGWLSLGGTLIGTARCMEFKERWGRLKAAKNMILRGIDALIVCGGDGSLTGADLFRSEWPSLIEELVSNGELSLKQIEPYKNLTIVGLVGSIDNDMSSTDNTIGAYSSLERICEMVDYIDSTASSHSRAFVVEVMGRHCGWLGLMAGISCGADFIFIPERPPSSENWKKELKDVCLRHRLKGRRKTTVIVAEGALDDELKPITSEQVKDCLVEIGLDTRITKLGHVQRGGSAVAFDRLLATLQGVDAVKAVLENKIDTPSPMISIVDGKIVRRSLIEAVKLTKQVAKSIENKEFDKAMSLRDSTFKESYENFLTLSKYDDGSQLIKNEEEEKLNIAIIHVGAPTAALNPATRAAALYCLSKGHNIYGIQNGFSGLIRHGAIKKLEWLDVEEWHNIGGSELGTNRSLPSQDIGAVAYYMQKFQINGLIIIGGFEAFQSLYELKISRKSYPIFNMPLICLPATVSNNVPGTEYSLGSDTCLNMLVNYCDAVKQSASASRRRVFVVEVQGGNSGYIASYSGLVTGALAVYKPEDKITLRSIQEDLELLNKNFSNDKGDNKSGKMFIRNENSSKIYTTDLIASIIKESANGKYESRTAIPGHVQQGQNPSSMDRCFASRFAIKACQFIEENNQYTNLKLKNLINEGYGSNLTFKGHSENEIKFIYKNGEKIIVDGLNNAMVIAIQGTYVSFKDIEKLYNEETDIKLRKGKDVHWHEMNDVNNILSGRLNLRNEKN
ncbi:hypothetical protein CANARDRAFT_29105 [[Candida] arabinofermentans NRRL YB-2248]|uniref:ATP-dependent 6-phosphofructokinase n=1 Tax=[Candida] arabinofermentans NRRL YB-2248 TaxID=983967 RepID=A0A1E4SYJ4_9ASCO|nr:hypothetical protein CANARDRAFT_29105 [[Candida] arabinofermentans NRRL YB-2248]